LLRYASLKKGGPLPIRSVIAIEIRLARRPAFHNLLLRIGTQL